MLVTFLILRGEDFTSSLFRPGKAKIIPAFSHAWLFDTDQRYHLQIAWILVLQLVSMILPSPLKS